MSNAEAGLAFDLCFGKAGIMEEETYYDPMRKVDKRERIGKAYLRSMRQKVGTASINVDTGGTFTGYGHMPPFTDPSVVDRTVRETPLVKLLARKAIRGRSYVYVALTAKAGAKFLDDDAPLADQIDTRTTTNVPIKYLYAVGRVTNPAQASGEGFLNLMAEDIRAKSASMNEALENEIVNGAVATDANGFDGLRTTITTNSTANGGAEITLAQIRDDTNTSFEGNGIIDLVVTDGRTFNYIKGLLMDFQRNIERPSGNMDFGIPDAFTFDGALFIKNRYMPTTASSREILYLDTRYIFLAVLQDVSYAELAQINDSQKYYLRWYGALVVNFESVQVKRTGLA
jgi:hypothetical protein